MHYIKISSIFISGDVLSHDWLSEIGIKAEYQMTCRIMWYAERKGEHT